MLAMLKNGGILSFLRQSLIICAGLTILKRVVTPSLISDVFYSNSQTAVDKKFFYFKPLFLFVAFAVNSMNHERPFGASIPA